MTKKFAEKIYMICNISHFQHIKYLLVFFNSIIDFKQDLLDNYYEDKLKNI